MLSLKVKRQLRRAASGRLTRPEALRKLKESPELAAECSEPESLHCHGCINSCRLGAARCELGRSVLSALRGVQ